MNDPRTDWLCAILGCGCADISLIEHTTYCYDDVLVELAQRGCRLTLASLCNGIIWLGKKEMQEAIDQRIAELEEALIECELHMTPEYRALLTVNPEEDIKMDFNYLDMHVILESNASLYLEYLMDECEQFQDHTGFGLEGDEE
ncbi:MAG: hypothetical protein IJ646_13350 [Clostridia bacterium]|nr:hypothetical protein [Clostridia bacterium]